MNYDGQNALNHNKGALNIWKALSLLPQAKKYSVQ